MRFAPVQAAAVRLDADSAPWSNDYGDVYHARAGAMGQAQTVFLAGNGLPSRWQGRDRFVVLETGFGLGHNFLTTWLAWKQDPLRCQHLFFVSMDRHPVSREVLESAHARLNDAEMRAMGAALREDWPTPSPDLHVRRFDGGRITLLLAHADVQAALRQFRLKADAVYLDGFSPRLNPQMWSAPVLKAVARLSSPQATLSTWTAAGEVQRGLQSAGFDVRTVEGWGGKRERIQAKRVVFPTQRRGPAPIDMPVWRAPHAPVVVVGAGLAGAACAQALARAGVACTVLERAPQVATGASGNPAGLFHGVLHTEDGVHARLGRAAALLAAREYRDALPPSLGQGSVCGLERHESQRDPQQMLDLIQALGLPPDYVQALKPDTAWDRPRWLYPAGGWLDPRAWVQQALREPGIAVRTGAAVHSLQRVGRTWVMRDAQGSVLARTGHVVLCQAAAVLDCLPESVTHDWPVGLQRGQITRVPAGTPGLRAPQRPRSGGGYALTLPNGDVWCGASASNQDEDPSIRARDHADNLHKLNLLTGSEVELDPGSLQGRVGWRFHTDDRLPLVGACPAFTTPSPESLPKTGSMRLRDWPVEPGLYLATALGSRGITWAPLVGWLLAAQVRGDPLPLPADLVDALDPRRFAIRSLRRSA
jgi:tRNA 5-methylaminomethyl-2-thiouridine biosynthesis bifunctional protein